MRNFALAFALIFSISMIFVSGKPIELDCTIDKTYHSDYSDGYSDGYCEGYKYIKGPYTICPVTPISPIPRVGESSYIDGYNRGFVDGVNKAEE